MSDTAENNAEQEVEQGVEIMSVKDAINFSQDIEQQPKEVKKEVIVEDEKPAIEEEVVAEKPAEKEVIEKEVVEDKKEEVVVEKAPEVKKDDNEDLYDDEDRAYFAFKKANKGATRADFQESKIDYDSLDRKELLRTSLREKYNLTQSDEKLDQYIEEELGIPMDADESEMSVTEIVAFRKEVDAYINEKKEQQKKWAENSPKEGIAQKEQEEIVSLEDGSKMPKKAYEKMVESRNKYIKSNEEALNRVNATSFKIEVDDNGSKRELEYSYEFSKEDKHRMLSKSSDVVADFNKTYTTKEGYDHDSININKAWEDPQLRGKMLKSMLGAARAEGIEEVMKDNGNITLGSQKGLPKQEQKGVKVVPVSDFYNS